MEMIVLGIAASAIGLAFAAAIWQAHKSYKAEKARRYFEWTPQKDITAYELARCLPALQNPNLGAWLDDQDESVRRHFTEV